MVNIHSLCLIDTPGLNDRNIHLIGKSLHRLEKLWLCGYFGNELTDIGLSKLFLMCKNLKYLSLHELYITGTCFDYLPKLKRFSISDQCVTIFDISKRLGNSLNSLFVVSDINITEDFFLQFEQLREVAWSIDEIWTLVKFLNQASIQQSIEQLAVRILRTLPTLNFNMINKFRSLKRVSLEFLDFIPDEDLKEIVAKFECVEELTLKFHDFGCAVCDECKHCFECDDWDPQKLMKTLEQIKKFQRLKKLTVFVDVYGKASYLCCDEFEQIASQLESLQKQCSKNLKIKLYANAKRNEDIRDSSSIKIITKDDYEWKRCPNRFIELY
ncbi:hypothetical protein B4U79_17436 [Dinothrombium tinctorium]|uniref:Uncharacterized protein n=1 Tax=Dinothrombium tinctorium TaxID=1965070 RepID=A0A3S3P8Z4_9ACAR|nr:hypothetical protein B4U79_17436 [Dinothrombium tinctorium]